MKDPAWLEEGNQGGPELPTQKFRQEKEEGPKMVMDIPSLRSITIRVRGKSLFHVGLTKKQIEAGEMLDREVMYDMEPIVMEHGRHAIIVCRFVDGTKQQYRGNGGVIRGPSGGEPTEFAKGLMAENRLRKFRLEIRRKMLEEGMDEQITVSPEQITEEFKQIGEDVT